MAADRKTQATKRTEERPSPFRSFKSLSSFPKEEDSPAGFIPSHGGYPKLLSYQKALVVYDATRYFCDRFFERRDRTRDQMIQAARSGKQNILEGSQASGTSKETEIKLTIAGPIRSVVVNSALLHPFSALTAASSALM